MPRLHRCLHIAVHASMCQTEEDKENNNGVTVDLSPLSRKPSNSNRQLKPQFLSPTCGHLRDLLKGPVVQLPPARQEDTQTIPDTCQFFFMSDNFLIATESKSLLCSILGIKKIAVFNSDNIDFICLFQM